MTDANATEKTDDEINQMAARSRLMRRLDDQDAARRRRPLPPTTGASAPVDPNPRKPQDSNHGKCA